MTTKEEKKAFLSLSLDDKIKRTKMLIMDWYAQFNGRVYVSFSGGKDSTVLLHIARQLYPDIVGVFDDTGLEYPEIRDFVKKQKNIIWIKPKLTFKEVIEKYGYPIISKEQSRYISDVRSSKTCEKIKLIRLHGSEKGHFKISEKWKPLIDSDFKISNRCCDVMKKTPLKAFEKETGLKPIVGIMADESNLRLQLYMKGDCNQFYAKHPTSHPMMFWTEQDVLEYIKKYNLEIADCYGKVEGDDKLKLSGVNRTGCMFCMYGVHLEETGNTRFDKMKKTHPKQYNYIMEKLNGRHVLTEYLKCDKKKPTEETREMITKSKLMKEEGYVRPSDDFYETPRIATCAMLNNVNIPEGVTLWEPSAGMGAISKVLEEVYGKERVLSTELNENRYGIGCVDFFHAEDYIPKGRFWIITNPPYNKANSYIRKCFEYGAERVICLLRFNYLESAKVREDLLGGGHLLRVLLIKERLNMTPFGWTGHKLSATLNHAWFIWDRNYENPVPSEIVVRRVNLIEGKAFAIQNGIELER